MKETTNFGLKKPEANDFYDFETQNENLDKIDKALQECKESAKNVSALTTNLLNPTLANYESGGITVTNNGDGTYTVNGTATGKCTFNLESNTAGNGKQLKLVGCPSGGSVDTYYLAFGTNVSNILCVDSGSGDIPDEPLTSDKTYRLYLVVEEGAVCDNLIFKPMLTTNLEATYDDFVPYTGSTGKLNGDVAEIRKNYLPLSGGTVKGKLIGNATSAAALGEKQFRNIYAGTDELKSGTSSLTTGNIYIQYE